MMARSVGQMHARGLGPGKVDLWCTQRLHWLLLGGSASTVPTKHVGSEHVSVAVGDWLSFLGENMSAQHGSTGSGVIRLLSLSFDTLDSLLSLLGTSGLTSGLCFCVCFSLTLQSEFHFTSLVVLSRLGSCACRLDSTLGLGRCLLSHFTVRDRGVTSRLLVMARGMRMTLLHLFEHGTHAGIRVHTHEGIRAPLGHGRVDRRGGGGGHFLVLPVCTVHRGQSLRRLSQRRAQRA